MTESAGVRGGIRRILLSYQHIIIILSSAPFEMLAQMLTQIKVVEFNLYKVNFIERRFQNMFCKN